MNTFQIVEVTEQLNHAGTKATADIVYLAENMGFQRVEITMDTTKEGIIGKTQRQIGYIKDWDTAFRVINEGSIVLLQHPFHHQQITRENILRKLKNKKKVRFISVVHDVEELRQFRYNEYYAHEFDVMLELADVLIVHNETMLNWFISKGVSYSKLINLGIFDYLQNNSRAGVPNFEKCITIAGNLDTEKCAYIGQLGELNKIRIDLFGPNFDKRLQRYPNIEYKGSFPVDEIPSLLKSGFGLVWDGESIDGCKGLSGQYLKYNNPHKLSLYLSAGLPVVIWSQAAEAKLIETNNLGIIVNSLYELPDILEGMSVERYSDIAKCVQIYGKKLRMGYFGTKAIKAATEVILGTKDA